MPKATPQDKLAALQQARSKQIDTELAAISAALAAILIHWQSSIAQLITSTSGLMPIAMLQFVTQRAGDELTRLQLPQLIQSSLKNYDSAPVSVIDQLTAIDYDPDHFEPLPKQNVQTLKAIDGARATALTSLAVGSIAGIVTEGRITGRTDSEIGDGIKDAVADLGKALDRTIDTGTLRVNRIAQWHYFSQITDKFKYAGPADERNRPFCREHVGKVYTAEQIGKMNNGMPVPWDDVRVMAGGIQCRHAWLAQLN